ncbi:helix-turn-helix domain-containing protein [Flammeovirga kamogawensis]|uniref:Transporter n=1 Tax=Flammeovirga kamogawensis TaxID=373891 RepID=A0ABX8GY67_9BACT|nr:transporter [Flammeovirga kamogawensis]MBB6458984.1 DNA-binding MarR family transcriptional regulator [Flammeovirga kamogawensis]QWG08559.1 transporter [Flammeovirga kamogawensis]TRX66850.1 transporter [Flammeovirga kamogawensis]
MTEIQYKILDELYFVTSFSSLKEEVNIDTATLGIELKTLIQKEWVRCFSSPSDEIEIAIKDFDTNFTSYHYLASKKGLFAHNSQ